VGPAHRAEDDQQRRRRAELCHLPTDSASQTWSKAFYLSNGACSVAVYYLLSANAGTHTVTWACGGTAYVNYALCEIPHCSAVDLVSTVGTASNTATTISTPSITTTNATDALFAVMSADAATGLSNAAITDPPSGWTSLFAQQVTNVNEGGQLSYKEVTSTGAQSVTWTFSADTTGALYAAGAVAFVQGAGSVSFAGAGVAKATGSGAFTPVPKFAGAGAAAAAGSGTLSRGLSGAGSASASGSGALTVRAAMSGAGAAVASGSGTLAPLGPTVTLKQYWLKPWQTGTTPASLQTGANPMTVAAGSTLIAVWAGWDSAQIAAPAISAGSFTTPTNGAQFNGANITTAIAYQQNAAGGSVTTTAPNVAVGNSGEVGVWIYEVANMPAVAVVRNCAGAHAVSSSQSWSQSSDSSPQVGDLAFAVTTYENSAGQVSAGLTDPPSGWTSQGVNQDATNFVPTEICSKIVSGAGTQTASWSNSDPNTTEHLSVMLTMQTAGATSVAFSGSGVALATGSGALTTRDVLTGAGAASAVGSAALTVSVPLAGAGSSAAAGAASLRTAAAPAGAGSAQAVGSGALTVAAVLAGSGIASAAGSASLTTSSSGANLSGAGVATATGSAALTVASALTGAGSTRATGAASLTVAAALSGAGAASAYGSATLAGGSAAVSFTGSGVAQATGAGALATSAALAGGGFSIATAAGVLTIGGGGVSFAGNGVATSGGAASLTPRPRFAGAGVASAVGVGSLALASPFVSGNLSVWLVPTRRTAAHVPARQIVARATD
jgi:hypothetical protein